MLQQHVDQGADVTVGCVEVPRMDATGFGVMAVDAKDRITSFLEKPADPPGMPGDPDRALASMGIYVFDDRVPDRPAAPRRRGPGTPATISAATSSRTSSATAGPWRTASPRRACAAPRETQAYWRDVGTVDAYWEANIDLTDFVPGLDLYDRDWPIWTYAEIVPPAKFIHDETVARAARRSARWCRAAASSAAAAIRRSRCCSPASTRIPTRAIEGAVVLPYADIGRHARLTNVVVDRGVRIPDGLVVGEDPALDAARFRRTERGVCLITQPMIDALGAEAAASQDAAPG